MQPNLLGLPYRRNPKAREMIYCSSSGIFESKSVTLIHRSNTKFDYKFKFSSHNIYIRLVTTAFPPYLLNRVHFLLFIHFLSSISLESISCSSCLVFLIKKHEIKQIYASFLCIWVFLNPGMYKTSLFLTFQP